MMMARERKLARAAEARRVLDADVRALAAALHPSLSDNPLVLRNLRLQEKLLGAAEPLLDKAQTVAGLKGTEMTNLTKILTAHTSSMAELLARIPPKDTAKDERIVPKSVVDWLDNIEYYGGPVRVIESGKSGAPGQAPRAQNQ